MPAPINPFAMNDNAISSADLTPLQTHYKKLGIFQTNQPKPNIAQQLISSAPELPTVEEALAQTRQLVLRSFAPKPFGGALATSPFGLAPPTPGSIGKPRTLSGA